MTETPGLYAAGPGFTRCEPHRLTHSADQPCSACAAEADLAAAPPVAYMERFDAAYWQAQAETAIRLSEASAADAARVRVQLAEAEAHCRDQHALLVKAAALSYHWPVRVGSHVTQALAADLQQWAAAIQAALEAGHE